MPWQRIPPPLIRPDLIDGDQSNRARARRAPDRGDIRAHPRSRSFNRSSTWSCRSIVFGRVALLGDAAFVARPHVGAGVTKAALDAASLAQAVRGDDLAAGLRHYQREQLPFGTGLVALGRQEGAYLSAQLKPVERAPRPRSTGMFATFCLPTTRAATACAACSQHRVRYRGAWAVDSRHKA